jgi:hypothetical protein
LILLIFSIRLIFLIFLILFRLSIFVYQSSHLIYPENG